MPSTQYKQCLDPAAMHAALEAFASRIVEAAIESGERDPARLKDYALDGFSL